MSYIGKDETEGEERLPSHVSKSDEIWTKTAGRCYASELNRSSQYLTISLIYAF